MAQTAEERRRATIEATKRWAKRNRARCRENEIRYQSQTHIRLYHNLKRRLQSQDAEPLAFGPDLVGCDGPTLVAHLESQFRPGMSWQTYGATKGEVQRWEVDHIVPVSEFNLHTLEGQQACNHYLNLQPLWRRENLAKHWARMRGVEFKIAA